MFHLNKRVVTLVGRFGAFWFLWVARVCWQMHGDSMKPFWVHCHGCIHKMHLSTFSQKWIAKSLFLNRRLKYTATPGKSWISYAGRLAGNVEAKGAERVCNSELALPASVQKRFLSPSSGCRIYERTGAV